MGSPPESGTTPPAPGTAEGAAGQGTVTPEKTTPPAGSEGDTPAAGTLPDLPPAKEGQKRVKCAALKGSKITIGTGEIIRIDENGIFAVEAKEAARLLTIPGYEEA
jgi:hypothetical protein